MICKWIILENYHTNTCPCFSSFYSIIYNVNFHSVVSDWWHCLHTCSSVIDLQVAVVRWQHVGGWGDVGHSCIVSRSATRPACAPDFLRPHLYSLITHLSTARPLYHACWQESHEIHWPESHLSFTGPKTEVSMNIPSNSPLLLLPTCCFLQEYIWTHFC